MSTIDEPLALTDPDLWPFSFSFAVASAPLERVQRAILARTPGVDATVEEYGHASARELFDGVKDLVAGVPDVHVIVRTKFEKVACFRNGVRGGDGQSLAASLASVLGCQTVAIGFVPPLRRTPDDRVTSPDRPVPIPSERASFALYEGRPLPRRTVVASRDSSRWAYSESGEPLSGEPIPSGTRQRRLDLDRLVALCLCVGVGLDVTDYAGASRIVRFSRSRPRGGTPPAYVDARAHRAHLKELRTT